MTQDPQLRVKGNTSDLVWDLGLQSCQDLAYASKKWITFCDGSNSFVLTEGIDENTVVTGIAMRKVVVTLLVK